MKRKRKLAAIAVAAAVGSVACSERPPSRPAPAVAQVERAALEDRDLRLPMEMLAKLQRESPAGKRNLFEFVLPPPEMNRGRSSDPTAAAGLDPLPRQGQVPIGERAPFLFYGYVTRQARWLRGFFSDGNEIYIMAEGEVIAGRFRVLRFDGNSALIEDTSKGVRQRLILDQD